MLAEILERQANNGDRFEFFGLDGAETSADIAAFEAFFTKQDTSDESETPDEYEVGSNPEESQLVRYVPDPRPYVEWEAWEQRLHCVSLTLYGSLSTRLSQWSYRLERGVRWWGALFPFNIHPLRWDPKDLYPDDPDDPENRPEFLLHPHPLLDDDLAFRANPWYIPPPSLWCQPD
jgi:hypothetical protein